MYSLLYLLSEELHTSGSTALLHVGREVEFGMVPDTDALPAAVLWGASSPVGCKAAMLRAPDRLPGDRHMSKSTGRFRNPGNSGTDGTFSAIYATVTDRACTVAVPETGNIPSVPEFLSKQD